MKLFNSIPGPISIPLIGSLYNYFPIIGKYSFDRLHHAGLMKYNEYGPMVREQLFRNVNLLHIFDAKDIRQIFINDGQYPLRRSHIALEKYRLDRPHMYSGGGLIPTNGEEWWKLRKNAQKVLSRIQYVRAQLPLIDQISCNFIDLIHNLIDSKSKEISNFLPYLQRAYLEMTFGINLDVRLGALDLNIHNDEVSQLLWASHASLKGIISTDNGIPLWKLFNTRVYEELVEGQNTVYRIALKYVDQKKEELKCNLRRGQYVDSLFADNSLVKRDEESFTTFEFSFKRPNLTKRDLMTIICDSILGGIDTTSYTTAFLLFHLAKNPEKQEILSQEAQTLLSTSGGKVTLSVLEQAHYMKAVLKEGLRLNPISVGIGRIATKDFALRGYLIPKGTIIITQNQVSCNLESNFVEAHKFLPERWLDKKRNRNSENLFIYLPFGYGPRSCIGRRIAEQNIYTLLLKVMNKFRLEWIGPDKIDCYTHLLNEPDYPISFKFVTRSG